MDALTSLRAIIQSANNLLLDSLDDVTPEQASALPPGTANSLAATYSHLVGVQDRYVNAFLLSQPTIWEREGWAERLGHGGAFRMSREDPRLVGFDPKAYRAYADRVFAETKEELAKLTDADLAREVQGYRGPISVGELLGRLIAFHAISHLGEIAALKGIQGMKGLPF